jgi:hypothetical protein
MNEKQLQNTIRFCGVQLISYILNSDIETIKNSGLNLPLFSETQILVLDDLYKNIIRCQMRSVIEGGHYESAYFYLRTSKIKENDDNLFNVYREKCGGGFPSVETEDKVLNFLLRVSIREYPNLLLKPSSSSPYQDLHGHSRVEFRPEDGRSFSRLVKTDTLNRITNGMQGSEYAFSFTTTDGLGFRMQVIGAYATIISRAFQNACNKMNYGINGFLKEVEQCLNSLRKFSRGEEIVYSTFIGIEGLSFHDFSCIELDGATLRQLDDLSNPSPHTTLIAVRHHVGDGEEYLSGHVFEIQHKLTLLKIGTDATCTMSEVALHEQNRLLDNLRFSLIFTLLEDKGINIVFSENGFPLMHPGNLYLVRRNPYDYFKTISSKDIEGIRSWFARLSTIELSSVEVPIKRLKYAIFERSQPEDSIVDAIIAWEGMFSEAFETSFKVTGSISKYLRDKNERGEFLCRLKKLYGLRSDLVHGKKNSLARKENIQDLRSEVIRIGIDCLKKLLEDNEFLGMTPPDRVKKIMIMD